MKTVRILVAAIAVVAALSGCSIVQTVNRDIAAAAVPRAGSCWLGDASDLIQSVTSAGTLVSCATRHDAYTFAIVRVPKSLTSRAWAGADSTDPVRSAVDMAAFDACFNAHTGVFPPLSSGKLSRFAFDYYLPSESAWLKGANWVRCDYSLHAFGSSYSEPEFANLPETKQTLIDEVNATPEKFFACFDTAVATSHSDPLGDEDSTFSDCTGNPRWRESWVDRFPPSFEQYPGDAEVTAYENAACESKTPTGDVLVIYGPTKETWSEGVRRIQCWVAAPSGSGGLV